MENKITEERIGGGGEEGRGRYFNIAVEKRRVGKLFCKGVSIEFLRASLVVI